MPDEEVIASWNNPTQSDSSWQATVQMAWQISAHLVIQLSVRYVHIYCIYIHALCKLSVYTYVYLALTPTITVAMDSCLSTACMCLLLLGLIKLMQW